MKGKRIILLINKKLLIALQTESIILNSFKHKCFTLPESSYKAYPQCIGNKQNVFSMHILKILIE